MQPETAIVIEHADHLHYGATEYLICEDNELHAEWANRELSALLNT